MKREAKSGTSILRRSATEIKRYRIMLRLLPIILGIITLILIITYIVTILYDRYGSFSVSVNKFANVRYALTLSETTDFTSPVSRLNSKASVDITNIDGSSLPNDLDNIDGEHNGKNYLAYTFYCKNAGQEAVTYRWTLAIKNASQEIEKAVRVRLYVNGEPTTYARTRTDGKGVEMDMDKNGNRTIPTTEFWKGSTIAQGEFANFQVGDITKYTIVVWLEGHDPDCNDDIIGGEFKIDMQMEILEAEEEQTAGN
ncbi:MAG: hypothetical protein J5885_05645 [Clostridia bacterium]|nr:hypothetical protein [Clostridia bacterium]